MSLDQTFPAMYYVKAALAGGAHTSPVLSFVFSLTHSISGICCSVTHGAVCPVDVVKTRIQVRRSHGSFFLFFRLARVFTRTHRGCLQLEPNVYNKGMISAFRTVVKNEGAGVLATGLGATAAGYFVQGWFKFGGVEFFKINIAQRLGPQGAWDNRNSIYLASAAMAEFIADLFLCPLEAVRIRSVSDPTFPKSLPGGLARIVSKEGVLGFYAGLGPILFKQIPYTMVRQVASCDFFS
jgi:solute carrier family 25 phosphate transporter 3